MAHHQTLYGENEWDFYVQNAPVETLIIIWNMHIISFTLMKKKNPINHQKKQKTFHPLNTEQQPPAIFLKATIDNNWLELMVLWDALTSPQ